MRRLFPQLGSWLLAAIMVLTVQLFSAPARATGVYEIPPLAPETWVLDKGEALSRLSENQIVNTLANLAQTTGNEVRFVTIRRFDYGETAETFTNKLFEKWFPTPEAQANQTLLVIDTLTNTTGIRTGEKVKTLLSDKIAQSVAQETVLVPLRDGDKYNQALTDASNRLVAVLSGKTDPGAPVVVDNVSVARTYKTAEETDKGSATVWVIGLLIAATVIPMVTYFFYQGLGS